MKLFVTLILFIGGTTLTAQTYFPFLEEDKYWTVEVANYFLPPVIYQETYFYQGDTVINSIDYKNYGVIIREDTVQKRVYLRKQGHLNGECLLYDFSAQTGDTLEVCSFIITIDSVSTILLSNNDIRKIFYYSGTVTGEYYIEGIGSSHGFRYLSEAFGPPSLDLMCVKQNNVEIYGSRCEQVLGLKNEINNKFVVAVFPNPTVSQLIIDSELEIRNVTIINVNGQTIKTIEKNFEIVNVADLQKGIYFLEITSSKGRKVTKKFIKQ